MMQYKFFTVEPLPLETGRKTRNWAIVNRSGQALGIIRWHGAWRQYCFFPDEMTLWSKGCLNDVLDAIEKIRTEPK